MIQGWPIGFLSHWIRRIKDGEIALRYMEAGLDSMKFSLNYADADQFASIAGVKASIYPEII